MKKSEGAAHEARQRGEPREPDHELARRGGVAHRYVLRLRESRDPAIVLRVLADLAIPLGYLLLLPSGSPDQLAAYLGLGAHDVTDLPIRFASRGVHVERGEELESGAGPMRDRIDRCAAAEAGPTTPAPATRAGATLAKRRRA